MARSVSITTDELLAALALAAKGDGPDDAKTVMEMAAEQGMTLHRVRRALAIIRAQGRLQAHIVRRPDLAGRIQQVPGYTVTPP